MKKRSPQAKRRRRPGKIFTAPPAAGGKGKALGGFPFALYDSQTLSEGRLSGWPEIKGLLSQGRNLWVHFNGRPDEDLLKGFWPELGVHPLALEDILTGDHRPKVEYMDSFVLLILRFLTLNEGRVESEQVSILLGKNYVFSFQPGRGDLFEPVRERLRAEQGRIRNQNTDYLAYCLMDLITDEMFHLLERVEESISVLDEELTVSSSQGDMAEIHRQKRNLIIIRHAAWPLREMVRTLDREDHYLIGGALDPFIRDLYDHTVHIIDTVEGLRDLINGMMDLYMSSVSNRMNEVMKVLTIISTIFMPLSFLAGVYGMNFNTASPFNMPELAWRYGYLLILGVMALVAAGMLWFFKRKKWL
jgi:magnesium transporter